MTVKKGSSIFVASLIGQFERVNERVFYVSEASVDLLSYFCALCVEFLLMLFIESERRLWCFPGGIPEQNPCFTGRHGCDTNAVCRPAQGKEFTCECAAGFTGDGRVCYGNDPRLQIMMFIFWISVCVQTSALSYCRARSHQFR